MAKILLPISSGFEEIETITIVDVCRRAEIEVLITSIEEIIVKGAHDIQITANSLINEVKSEDFDMIVLPGGLPNAFNLAQNLKVQELLKEFKSENKNIGAICAAPYALHTANVLNKNYTCYPSFEQKIREEGYHDSDAVVIDDKVITSRGPATAMNFALEIVRMFKGDDKYQEVKEQVLL